MNLLLIEDYPSIQDIYKEVLTKAGHQVEVIADGATALSRLQDNQYDLVILDILLPNLTGVELLRKVQKLKKKNKFPKVLVLSDFDKPELVQEVLKLGAVKYLIKVDYTPAEIVKIIEDVAAGEPSH